MLSLICRAFCPETIAGREFSGSGQSWENQDSGDNLEVRDGSIWWTSLRSLKQQTSSNSEALWAPPLQLVLKMFSSARRARFPSCLLLLAVFPTSRSNQGWDIAFYHVYLSQKWSTLAVCLMINLWRFQIESSQTLKTALFYVFFWLFLGSRCFGQE